MLYSTHHASPIGSILLAGSNSHLVGAWVEGQKYFGSTISGEFSEKDDLPVLTAAKKWLDAYFAGEKPEIAHLPLAPAGGEFRKAVWDILCDIPYGQCVTYGEIAKKMAARMNKKTMSSQAVGGAVGHNPISIIIPLLFPATGWWGQTAASQDMQGESAKKSNFWSWKALIPQTSLFPKRVPLCKAICRKNSPAAGER